MESYDTFNENGSFISSEDERDVHFKGLWHKVMRVWLYDKLGNIYLRQRKTDGKFDCINELHILSNESQISCFDRGMYERLGIHLSASSNLKLISTKKVRQKKLYSDGTEKIENYFLCDYIGEFDGNSNFLIFDEETKKLVKFNASGVLNLISSRQGEIIGYDMSISNNLEEAKLILKIDDIYDNGEENLHAKYNNIILEIEKENDDYLKNTKDLNKIDEYIKTNKSFVSHAKDNEGSEIY